MFRTEELTCVCVCVCSGETDKLSGVVNTVSVFYAHTAHDSTSVCVF